MRWHAQRMGLEVWQSGPASCLVGFLMLPDVNEQSLAPATESHGLLFCHTFSPVLDRIPENVSLNQCFLT